MRIVQVDSDYEHLPTIAGWVHDQWGHYHPGRDIAGWLELLRAIAGCTLIPSMYIAELDDAPVGTASVVECDLPLRSELTPWLASVFVAPEHRRRGIASALVTHVETTVCAAGIDRLYLFTPDQQRLYARLGWRIFEELDYRSDRITVMDRDLLTGTETGSG